MTLRLRRHKDHATLPVRLRDNKQSLAEESRDQSGTRKEPQGTPATATNWCTVGLDCPSSEGSGHVSEKRNRERPSQVLGRLHPDVDTDEFRPIIAAACRFVRNSKVGAAVSRSESELIRRSIRSNWPTEPGKLKKTVADLVATLDRDQSAGAATSAAETLRLAMKSGIFPAITTGAAS